VTKNNLLGSRLTLYSGAVFGDGHCRYLHQYSHTDTDGVAGIGIGILLAQN